MNRNGKTVFSQGLNSGNVFRIKSGKSEINGLKLSRGKSFKHPFSL